MKDLPFVSRMLADPVVMRYWPRVQDRDEARLWIQRNVDRYSQQGCGIWVASTVESPADVGLVGLAHVHFDHQQALGLAYMLDPTFWGRGFATEASIGCICHAIHVMGASEVAVLIRPENEESLAVMIRLGLEPSGETMFHDLRHTIFWARPEDARRLAVRALD